jgi:hypothetical protein
LLCRCGFAPAPFIDLFWHSHLLRPASYFRDTSFLCFCTPHHKLLPEEARTEFLYNAHSMQEEAIWEEEFNESLSDVFQ